MSATPAERLDTSANTPATPRGYQFKLRHLSFILVAVGLGLAGYLSYGKLFAQQMACVNTGIFNCDLVQKSIYSMFLGVPVAVWGFLTHLLLGTILVLETRVEFVRTWGPFMLGAITLFGVMFHAYLTYASAFILGALCPWCLAAAATMVVQCVVCWLRIGGTMRATRLVEPA